MEVDLIAESRKAGLELGIKVVLSQGPPSREELVVSFRNGPTVVQFSGVYDAAVWLECYARGQEQVADPAGIRVAAPPHSDRRVG